MYTIKEKYCHILYLSTCKRRIHYHIYKMFLYFRSYEVPVSVQRGIDVAVQIKYICSYNLFSCTL